MKAKYTIIKPRPAGVFGRTRTAGGRGQILLPLSNTRTDGRKKTVKNDKRKLSTKRILGTPKILLKEVRGQVKGQNYRFPHYWLPSPTGAALIGAIHPERVHRLVRRGAVLKTLCLQRSRSRSGQVTKGHLLNGVGATHVLWVILPIESNGGTHLVIWATSGNS